MKPHKIRRVPWTCEWGRFGVVIEELGVGRSRVDDVFWACRYPSDAPHLRLTTTAECEQCPFWIPAARLGPHV